jgi:hypothetical protein
LVTKFEAKSFYNTLLDTFAMKTTIAVALAISGMLAATAAIFAQQMTLPAFAASSAAAGTASSTDGTAAANADTGANSGLTDSAAGGAAGGTQSAGGDTAICSHSMAGGPLFFGGACTGSP